jgi:hypothetical protein
LYLPLLAIADVVDAPTAFGGKRCDHAREELAVPRQKAQRRWQRTANAALATQIDIR